MSQADLVFAFVQQSQGKKHVAFSKRGNGPRGYVNVFGPSHDPRNAKNALVVIQNDGSVAFKNVGVANALQAPRRFRGKMAPGTGAAKWELSSRAITKYGGAGKLVQRIVAKMKLHASW